MIIGITWWSLKKIDCSIFEYLNNKVDLGIMECKLHDIAKDKCLQKEINIFELRQKI